MMGGRLWLESQHGMGSQFHFVVRLDVPEHVDAVPPPAFDLRTIRALVVDDNATNRRILAEILESWQMAAVGVATAAEALDALRAAVAAGQPFHLVLTDALMPDVDGFALAEQIAADNRLKAVKIVLLTSAGLPALRGRRAAIFVATLVKPVKQSELLDAIVTAFATPDAAARRRRAKPPRRPRRAGRALRVLVAEDNPTNQKLVSVLLDQQGHHVTIVHNGRLAVERAAQEPFDIILMDVQMPEMSGLEATAAIREREQSLGGHIPIVAMTAHAMTGDREHCLAAGMDAYVSKPLRLDELLAVVDGLFTSVTQARPFLDPPTLLSAFGGNRKMLAEVIDIFLVDSPELTRAIRQAAVQGDGQRLASSAHALKGSAGLFGKEGAYETARRLEQLGKSGDLTGVGEACTELEREMDALCATLAELRKDLL
jgi:CheY-like chemotaxis protein